MLTKMSKNLTLACPCLPVEYGVFLVALARVRTRCVNTFRVGRTVMNIEFAFVYFCEDKVKEARKITPLLAISLPGAMILGKTCLKVSHIDLHAVDLREACVTGSKKREIRGRNTHAEVYFRSVD